MREHLPKKVPTQPLNTFQAKAIVNEPGDSYEQEADRVADHVLCMPEPGAGEIVPPSGASETAQSRGQPLDAKTRASMESRFGFDFSRIRVHADSAAAESARSLGARAYAVGPNIVFGAGQFAPETPGGRRLLAHELVHVLQQRAAPASSDAAVATSRAGGMVQRQTAGTARTPADNVRDAVALLKNVQPLLIQQALSAAPVDGAFVQVHSVQHAKGGKPVTSIFMLKLKVGPLKGFSIAQFEPPSVPKQSAGTQTFEMTITVSNAAANFPAQTLARDLFHEGMHMQLFIDRTAPSWSSSLYLKGYQDYLATARKNDNYGKLLPEVTAFITKNVRGKTRAVAASEAKQIVETIIEEKFVIDTTDQTNIGGITVPTPTSGRFQLYLPRTTRWLVTYLGQVGVTNFPMDEIRSMSGKLVTLWIEIDEKAPRPPRYPTPLGMRVERAPDILPPPLPAALP